MICHDITNSKNLKTNQKHPYALTGQLFEPHDPKRCFSVNSKTKGRPFFFPQISDMYGITDVSMVIGNDPNFAIKPGSCGMPIPGFEVKYSEEN